ncbi:MAG: threonine synthase [Saprospiraceae bacterium]|nr:threonine synthase [Saprospiraceae bacterium]
MQLYSTNNSELRVDFKEALFKGLPDDNGLFMPCLIPKLPESFLQNLPNYTFPETAFTVAHTILQGAIPEDDLQGIITRAINFSAPVIKLTTHQYILELFHGPSQAFKDFGARFMAETMSYFNRSETKELVILVATSGDTGGAVASGFYQTPGIKVVILYPSDKVSPLQEKQLTTLGHNIQALEVNGTFDDCQALVKQAFLDTQTRDNIRLSSANSINIARLIPQSFYYFEAYKQVIQDSPNTPVSFIIPSGNFGNLTAGILAKRMGLPIQHLVAATNINNIVPEYLSTGKYQPRSSKRTISNAMDVGNPSNFARMDNLYGSTWNIMQEEIKGFYFTDEETADAMRSVQKEYNYTLDPHGAVAYLGMAEYLELYPDTTGVLLETAHPAKFIEDVEEILHEKIAIPEALKSLEEKEKHSILMEPDFEVFKSWLLEHY